MKNLDEENVQDEAPKRPNFLVFLLVLTSISVILLLYGSISAVFQGPKSAEYMEEIIAEQNEQLAELKNLMGKDDGALIEAVESSVNLTIHTNDEVFYSFHLLSILQSLLGIAAIVFMFKLRKIGFHLYVGYCILPIIVIYALFPAAYISNFMILGTVLISGLFCLLYGLNLKHMK